MNRRSVMLAFLLVTIHLLISPYGYAQSRVTVRGTVTDDTDFPIAGATVMVKGSTKGAATNLDGQYVLENVPSNAVLIFRFVGMTPQEVPVDNRTEINVVLKDDLQQLEEVVVIGYGSAKAKDLTAPIQVVKSHELVNVPTTSPMGALQGKVPGVNIINSGTPGEGPKVAIRGMGSFGDTSPLYVVDGMFYDNINFLNNSDIQEMTILKDASAAAIYGVRAANGVVIITTKKGKKNQDAHIVYNGYVGIQKATNLLKMANSHEYATMLMEADPEAYKHLFEKSVKEFGGNLERLEFNADTDWYKELLRTAYMTNHSINISGGSEKASYSTGVSYLSQDGIMNVENYFKRLNFRATLDYDARPWLKVGFNGVFSNSDRLLPKNNAWQSAFNTPSIIPVMDERRSDQIFPKKYASPEQVGFASNFSNPIAMADYYDNRNRDYQVLSNFYTQVNIIPEKLNVRSSYSYDFSLTKGVDFTPTYYVGVNQKSTVTSLTKSNSNYYRSIWDNIATYTDKWGKHDFTAMLGASVRDEQYRFLSGTASNVPEGEDAWKYLSLGNKEGSTVTDDGTRYRGLSYFTRLNYGYADKYLLMLTFRADGSSKYNEKWGFFPSVGTAWVISQEDFMKNQSVFDYMKLRASWGKLGNDKVAASAGFSNITPVQAVFGGTALDGYTTASTFSWLAWELVNETNVGLNFTNFDNRLSTDIDWYYRLTENAVISPMVPMQNITLPGNYGEILNSGLDLSMSWTDKISKDFSYNVGFNMAYLHNEVKSLKDGITMVKGGKTVNKVGEKMNSYYGYKVIGIYQTPEEIAADPIGKANSLKPGDFKYEDVNGDGLMDGRDMQILGSHIPSFTYGIHMGMNYKNFDLSLSTYGQAGGQLWNRKRALRYAQSNFNFDKAQFDNRWTGPGSTNSHPSSGALIRSWNVSDSNNASYFMESSDYFRIQNVTLGYSFRDLELLNLRLPSLRLTFTADRPYTFFKANSFTPELSDPEGWDTNVYPLTSTYTFGLQIDL